MRERERLDGEPIRPDDGDEIRRLPLAGSRGAVARCRAFTRSALADWGWLDDPSQEYRVAAEDVLLVVSELVTNACLHATGPDELVLRRTGGTLRVEVTDGEPTRPAIRDAGAGGRPGGYGLLVVNRLSRAWGSDLAPDRSGKTVWLELVVPPPS